MVVVKVDDQPGGAAFWEEVSARPAAEFDLNKVSEESRAALRNATTLEEFKKASLTIQYGREAALTLLGLTE
ncbi:hypothetical protein [Maridesulfovibrio ferrireducens]|uniref:hypothetical protein n=1 Tax=Maridesulfovibrio ferrireducens TaxID=246191 RepID=UPI001A22CD5C|nr:hypothetical protein [Maridesulfovibrio ferrireducens]MBI9110316.1 hypothetical protein [Maridesulfovibrio ferrireducens]